MKYMVSSIGSTKISLIRIISIAIFEVLLVLHVLATTIKLNFKNWNELSNCLAFFLPAKINN